MSGWTAQFEEYASYHQTRGNKATHVIGIPMIIIGLFGLLSHLQWGSLSAAHVFLAAVWVWYFTKDSRLALYFLAPLLALYVVGTNLSTRVLVAIFIFGWVLQFLGHVLYEKKSPAFFKNFLYTLIGPIWLFADLIGYWKGPGR